MTNNIKLKEDQFIQRLKENLSAAAGGGSVQASDEVARLRELTGGKLLRNELQAKYPLGKSVSMRIRESSGWLGRSQQAVVLAGKVVLHLESIVQDGADTEPVSSSELHGILQAEHELANRLKYCQVLGLYSPTGWAEDAIRFIKNEPAGSGWAASVVYPILIGPEITQLVWDRKQQMPEAYLIYFNGLTEMERGDVCRGAIEQAIKVQEFANLDKIAGEFGWPVEFVKSVAKRLEADRDDLKLAKVKDVGLVLKRRT